MGAANTIDHVDVEQRDALMERMLQASMAMFDVYSVFIGDRLGFYRALAEGGPQTSRDLAARTGTIERYVREWLEQQAVSRILAVEDADVEDGQHRRYSLPSSYYEILVDRDSPNFLAPLPQVAIGAAQPVHAVIEAFRRGGGVPYADYGPDLREGQGGMNRVLFLEELGQKWLPSIPDVDERLRNGRPARVADIGTGVGWASIGMARAYPNARVDGFDLDELSIEQARRNVAGTGVAERVQFFERDAADLKLDVHYDLVTALECVHDMSDPVGVLATMRRLAGSDGAVLVMDERVADRFMDDGNELDAFYYGFSVLHCLPAGMAESPSAGTGTVMRADTLRQYALEAGFRRVEVLPIDNIFFRVYRLHQ